MNNILLLLKRQFLRSLVSFVCSFISMKISRFNENSMHLYNFHYYYFKKNKYKSLTLGDFWNSFEGYLFLNLVQYNNFNQRLDSCIINGIMYYILNGTYIVPFASQLVLNTETTCLLLDPTWKILNNYVSSIPTVIIQNVRQPLVMLFVLTEDANIYNEFFDQFKNVLGYSISDSLTIVESDQGKALKKAANDQDMFHICCLRYLQVSLGRNIYSYQVGNLVKKPQIIIIQIQ
ncbi:hypothetical protein M9Y10_035747 [Tritrichomonas musculus]|uniref:MULE transposase domain-containing protein n=1 Tax=Tritrichomonas musculus TaxID=1915356 RepID=A0ABR2GWM3_9EUKA